jgi:hypothetical protein
VSALACDSRHFSFFPKQVFKLNSSCLLYFFSTKIIEQVIAWIDRIQNVTLLVRIARFLEICAQQRELGPILVHCHGVQKIVSQIVAGFTAVSHFAFFFNKRHFFHTVLIIIFFFFRFVNFSIFFANFTGNAYDLRPVTECASVSVPIPSRTPGHVEERTRAIKVASVETKSN